MKRYFIVFWSGFTETITTDGAYLNARSLIRWGKAPYNIIELTESDYKDWVK